MRQKDIPDWFLQATQALMESVRLKDPETFEHCVRVSHGARLLAEAAGLPEYHARVVEFAGLFHDIGKIGVPDAILHKPAKLTTAEFDVMKTHPEMSVQLLKPLAHLPFVKDILPGVRYHHERVDGRGYPDALKGDRVPLEARMVLIADTFDAMTASRAYRSGLPAEVAYKELKDFAGTQFDAQLVKIYLKAHPLMRDREQEIRQDLQVTIFRRIA